MVEICLDLKGTSSFVFILGYFNISLSNLCFSPLASSLLEVLLVSLSYRKSVSRSVQFLKVFHLVHYNHYEKV